MSLNIKPISFGMIIPIHESSKRKSLAFQHSSELKTLFKKGLLPTVKVDVMGNKLTMKNVTLDHIIPKSKGGLDCIGNYMLAENKFNSMRGSSPLSSWATPEGIVNYLDQFIGVKVRGFIGNKYIEEVLKTLEKANELKV